MLSVRTPGAGGWGRTGAPARSPALIAWMRFSLLLALVIACSLAMACGQEAASNPQELLLAPGDFREDGFTVVSLSEEQSLGGPSAQVQLQGSEYRVIQSIVLYENREMALEALDGIRADLVSRGDTGPGGVEFSGVLEHLVGNEDASSLFFIEGRALVRMTTTGAGREERLSELVEAAREKISQG